LNERWLPTVNVREQVRQLLVIKIVLQGFQSPSLLIWWLFLKPVLMIIYTMKAAL